MTQAMRRMEADGHPVSDGLAEALSPYMNEQINRFGKYDPKFSQEPDPIVLEFRKPPQGETGKILVMPQPRSKLA